MYYIYTYIYTTILITPLLPPIHTITFSTEEHPRTPTSIQQIVSQLTTGAHNADRSPSDWDQQPFSMTNVRSTFSPLNLDRGLVSCNGVVMLYRERVLNKKKMKCNSAIVLQHVLARMQKKLKTFIRLCVWCVVKNIRIHYTV